MLGCKAKFALVSSPGGGVPAEHKSFRARCQYFSLGARHYRWYEGVFFFCGVVLKVYKTLRELLFILSKELP